MIVSHEHRFIFLKTRKTAGTSIEIALSQHCGPDDIITPISPEDEELRRQVGARGPQNYQSPPLKEPAWNHMGASIVRRIVGREVWSSYYKFAVERDPWDVVLSSYNLTLARRARKKDLETFVAGPRLAKLARNPRIYRLRGRIAVDKVCRYERLVDDLEEVWSRLGLPLPVELPRAKSTPWSGPRVGRDAYTPEAARMVGEAFKDTVDAFGYSF